MDKLHTERVVFLSVVILLCGIVTPGSVGIFGGVSSVLRQSPACRVRSKVTHLAH